MKYFFVIFLIFSSVFIQAEDLVDSIVVYKGDRRMLLLNKEQEIVREYDIKLSYSYNNPFFTTGPKRLRGDNQTPEGDYIVKDKISAKWSNFKKSLLLNYPNKKDIEWGAKNGHTVKELGDAIQIHGYPKVVNASLKKAFSYVPFAPEEDEDLSEFFKTYIYPNFDWTNGCIAVSDEEMDEIFSLVTVKTKISIHP